MSLPDRVRRCIANAKAAGIAVRPGTWGIAFEAGDGRWKAAGGGCCALGAVLVMEGRGVDGRRPQFPGDGPRPGDAASALLGVPRAWVGAFCEGVAGAGTTTYPGMDAAWRDGLAIRAEITTEE